MERLPAAGKAFTGHLLKVTVESEARRDLKFRKRIVDLVQLEVATLGDGQSARQQVFAFAEDAAHLVGALYEELVAVKLQAVGVMNRLAGLDADQNVLRMRIVLAEIVAVIGRHHGDAKLFFQMKQVGLDAVLFRQSLVLDFEKEIVFAENLAVESGGIARGIVLAGQQVLAEFAGQASGKPNQHLGVLGQELLLNMRLRVEAVSRGCS